MVQCNLRKWSITTWVEALSQTIITTLRKLLMQQVHHQQQMCNSICKTMIILNPKRNNSINNWNHTCNLNSSNNSSNYLKLKYLRCLSSNNMQWARRIKININSHSQVTLITITMEVETHSSTIKCIHRWITIQQKRATLTIQTIHSKLMPMLTTLIWWWTI